MANKVINPFGIKLVPIQSDKTKLIENNYSGLTKTRGRDLLWHAVFNDTKNLNGAICEFGVAAGAGLIYWLNLKRHYKDDVKLYAFDSFCGFPEGTAGKDADWFLVGNVKINYQGYTLEYVKKNISNADFYQSIPEISFVEGFMPQSFEGIILPKIRIANLDLDLYSSTRDALRFVWPRLVSGGVVLIDEYDLGRDLEKWPGSKIAVDEFCAENEVMVHRHFTGRVFLMK